MTDEPAAAQPSAEPTTQPPEPRDGGDIELLALIDRLATLLERSDLSELEVESGGTGLILRKPVFVAGAPTTAGAAASSPAAGEAPTPTTGEPSTAFGRSARYRPR